MILFINILNDLPFLYFQFSFSLGFSNFVLCFCIFFLLYLFIFNLFEFNFSMNSILDTIYNFHVFCYYFSSNIYFISTLS